MKESSYRAPRKPGKTRVSMKPGAVHKLPERTSSVSVLQPNNRAARVSPGQGLNYQTTTM